MIHADLSFFIARSHNYSLCEEKQSNHLLSPIIITWISTIDKYFLDFAKYKILLRFKGWKKRIMFDIVVGLSKKKGNR